MIYELPSTNPSTDKGGELLTESADFGSLTAELLSKELRGRA